MGLTVHYDLHAKDNMKGSGRRLVEAMRQVCMDLPFDQVDDVIELKGSDCKVEKHRGVDDDMVWLLSAATMSVQCPWNRRISMDVVPTRVIGFTTTLGPGCETADFGLCRYPREIAWQYRGNDDERFERVAKEKGRTTYGGLDWDKWQRYHRRHFGANRR